MIKLLRQTYYQLKRPEKRFVYLTIGLILLLTCLPPLTGLLSAPAGYSYTNVGFLAGADKMVYLSQIEEASQGRLLFKNLYTAEPQAAQIFSPLWLAMGWLSLAASLSPLIIFHLFRVILGFIFLWLLYLFLARIFSKIIWRKTALLVLGLGSGLGVFTISGNWSADYLYEHLGTDLWVSEGNTFLTLYHSPLFILSQILLLLIFWWLIERLPKARLAEAAGVGWLILFLGIIHPYDLFTVLGVTVGWFAAKCLRAKKFFKKIFFKLAIIGLIGSLSAVYFYWLKLANPVFAGWLSQNVTLSPKLANYLIVYGLIFVFYLLGLYRALKSKNKYLFFLGVWSVVGWFLLFMPLQFQRRLANGLHLPLAIIAVVGLVVALNYFRKKKIFTNHFLRSITAQGLALLLVSSTLFFIGTELVLVAWRRYPIYIPKSYALAFDWLKANLTNQEPILSSAQTGNIIPAFTGRLVYLGHGHQTADWQQKKPLVDNFFKDNVHDEAKRAWLVEQNIAYLFYGSFEESLGDFNPRGKDYLMPLFQADNVTIYKVAR